MFQIAHINIKLDVLKLKYLDTKILSKFLFSYCIHGQDHKKKDLLRIQAVE
jgi:hypothetical protein